MQLFPSTRKVEQAEKQRWHLRNQMIAMEANFLLLSSKPDLLARMAGAEAY